MIHNVYMYMHGELVSMYMYMCLSCYVLLAVQVLLLMKLISSVDGITFLLQCYGSIPAGLALCSTNIVLLNFV